MKTAQIGRVHLSISDDFENVDGDHPWTLLLVVWRLAFGLTVERWWAWVYLGWWMVEIYVSCADERAFRDGDE